MNEDRSASFVELFFDLVFVFGVTQVVNVNNLNRFPADSEVTPDSLREAGLIRKKNVPVKLLGTGEIDRPLKVTVHACSSGGWRFDEGSVQARDGVVARLGGHDTRDGA